MKRLLFVISLSIFTLAACYGQSLAKVKKVDSHQNEIVQKARKYLASNSNLVFYLPCDNVPGWDNKLTGSHSVVFGADRFNNREHAIVFSAGHQGLQAKPGDYFTGDFSISVWVNVQSVSKWSRIIDFGKGQNNSNIVFSNSASMSGIPGMAIYKGEGTDITQIKGKEKDRVKEGEWHQIGASLKDSVARLYLDGVEISKAEKFYTPGKDSRPICLIGKSNFEGESNFYGSMDELRIYNKALSDIEMKLLAGWIFEYDSIIPPDTTSAPIKKPDPKINAGVTPDPGSAPIFIQSIDSIVLLDTIITDTLPPFPLPKELVCSKFKYTTVETPEFKKPEEIESAFNEILKPINGTNMRLISDFSKLRAYTEDNYTEKWEHKFIMFPKGDYGIQILNSLGKQGWELSYYQVVGATVSRPVNPALLKTWEYTIAKPPRYSKDEKELSANKASAEAILNDLGSQGWELKSILKEMHILQRQIGQKQSFAYRIIQGTGVVPYNLSAEGWEFAACPVITNSVNFQTPIVIKKSNVPNYRIYLAEQIERMGLFGGGNRYVYRDQDEAIAKYAALGWRYEGISDGLEGADIIFSAPLNCIDPSKPVIYYNFAKNDMAAQYFAVKFAQYMKGEKNCQVIKHTYATSPDVERAGIEAETPVILNAAFKGKLPDRKEVFITQIGFQLDVKIMLGITAINFRLHLNKLTMSGLEGEIQKMASKLFAQ